MARCAGTKPDGTPCERIVGASQTFCFAHNPAKAEQRRRAASKAGKSKPGWELVEVKRQLRGIADDVIAGRLETSKGSVAAQVLGVFLRCVEQERRQRELEELAGRIQALEQAQQQRGESRRWRA